MNDYEPIWCHEPAPLSLNHNSLDELVERIRATRRPVVLYRAKAEGRYDIGAVGSPSRLASW